MRKCVFCKRCYKKGSNTSFHRFPTNFEERSMWLHNMKALNWTPKEKDYLCSKHFNDKCLIKHCNRTTLKLGSVPTIFEGVFEEPNSCEQLDITDIKRENVPRGKDMDAEEPQPAVSTYPYKYDPNSCKQLEITEIKRENVYRGKDMEAEESQPAASTYPYKYDSNSCEQLELTDIKRENVSRGKDMDAEEPQPAVSTYPYKYAISTSPILNSMGTSSSSMHQSLKQRGSKRLSSEITFKDNVFQEDTNTRDELKRDLKDSASNDHNYEAFQTPKKSRIEYGVRHDHRYETTPKSSKKAVEFVKGSLKLSNSRVKALTQRVKRLKIKVTTLKTIINDLKKRNRASEECICRRPIVKSARSRYS